MPGLIHHQLLRLRPGIIAEGVPTSPLLHLGTCGDRLVRDRDSAAMSSRCSRPYAADVACLRDRKQPATS